MKSKISVTGSLDTQTPNQIDAAARTEGMGGDLGVTGDGPPKFEVGDT